MGEIHWHISALMSVKFMPREFLDCLSSEWLAGLTAEMSQTTQQWSDKSNWVTEVEHTMLSFGLNITLSRV